MPDQPAPRMPRFFRRREVSAFKIHDVEPTRGGGAILKPSDSRLMPITVDRFFVLRHSPEAGGFYVINPDTSAEFIPAETFKAEFESADPPEPRE